MNVLGIFARHPQPGKVKTRLAADLGPEAAAELYAAFVADLLGRFRGVADRRIIAYAPDNVAARDYFKVSGGGYELWPQPNGEAQKAEGGQSLNSQLSTLNSLGDRMGAFFDHAFASGAARVVLIGSDSPTLPVEFVQGAFGTLADRDCVIGPATDGGYYLIGLRSPCRELFRNIAWGGPDVLLQTVERVLAAGLRFTLGPVWYDVDDVADLRFLRGHLAAMQAAGEPTSAQRTAACLWRDISRGDAMR